MPGYIHECTCTYNVDEEYKPLMPLQLPHYNTNHNPRWSNCTGSKRRSTLNPSYERFSTFVKHEKLTILSKGIIPINTDRNTRWALSNFFGLEGYLVTRGSYHSDLSLINHPCYLGYKGEVGYNIIDIR